MNAKPKNNKDNKEKEKERKTEPEVNDIKSRLRRNPNKTKPLYLEEYPDKITKAKENEVAPSEKDICRKILDIIKKDEKSNLFRQPAIRAFAEKEEKDYYKQQIKEPRDLGNITKRLKSSKYTTKEFHDDLELCWSNAILFNETNTEAYKNAEYLKDLCDKLYKEYRLLDIINKEKEKEKDNDKDENKESEGGNNIVQNDENKNNNENNIENIENNDININNNEINEEVNDEKNNNTNKTNNKIIGKKRKRNDDISEINETKEKKVERKREINTRYGFLDIKNKFIINHPILTCPNDIPKLVRRTVFRPKRKAKKIDKSINTRNKNHSHHTNMQHISYYHKDKRLEINEKDYPRKIEFEWVEFLHYNKFANNNNKIKQQKEKDDVEIDISNSQSEQIQNNKMKENNDNGITNNNESLYDDIKIENEEMAKFDINFNAENVYDLDAKKETSKKGIKGIDKNNYLNNQYNLYNIGNIKTNTNETNYINPRNNKKNDKNFAIKNEIAKYFDKLSDNIMIELLVYIENIRPQSIKELANDTIYINM